MNKTYPLCPSTEIVTAFLSAGCANDETLYNSLKADPIATILSLTRIDFSSLEIIVIENTESECALVLPFYESAEQVILEMLADENLHDIAGGEIGGSILAFFGFIGAAIGIGTVTTGTFYGSVAVATAATLTTVAVTTYSTSAVVAGVAATIAVGAAGLAVGAAAGAGVGVLASGLAEHSQGK